MSDPSRDESRRVGGKEIDEQCELLWDNIRWGQGIKVAQGMVFVKQK